MVGARGSSPPRPSRSTTRRRPPGYAPRGPCARVRPFGASRAASSCCRASAHSHLTRSSADAVQIDGGGSDALGQESVPGDPRQRRVLPALLLHRRQRRVPGRLGERPDRRARPGERARPRPQDHPARRRRGQARADLQRPAEEARPAARRRPARDRLHDAAGARGHRPRARQAAPRRAADRAGHRHLPRPQPGHRTARLRADGAAAQVLRRPPRARPRGADDLRRRGQPPRLLPRGTAAPRRRRPRPHHPADAARVRARRDPRLPGRQPRRDGPHGRSSAGPRAKAAVLAAGIHAMYAYERLGGWRRMVSPADARAPRRAGRPGDRPAEPPSSPEAAGGRPATASPGA